MKVHEFMITDVYSVEEDTSLYEVMQKMATYRIGGLPVLDKKHQLVGMVSDGDILRYMKPKDEFYANLSIVVFLPKEELKEHVQQRKHVSVKGIMKKKHLKFVYETDEIEKALDLMALHHFKKLPVLNEQKQVVGVISRGDIVRQLMKQFL